MGVCFMDFSLVLIGEFVADEGPWQLRCGYNLVLAGFFGLIHRLVGTGDGIFLIFLRGA
jgi:hypothetical protein